MPDFFLLDAAAVGFAWALSGVGRFIWEHERRGFQVGLPTAGSAGQLLASQRIRMYRGGSEREGLEVSHVHTRRIDDETLLFAPVLQPSGRSFWRLEWFGRVRRAGDEALVEARLAAGTPLVVAGRLAMAMMIGVLLLARSSYVLSAIAFSMFVIAAHGYYRTWVREQARATEIVRAIAMKLGAV